MTEPVKINELLIENVKRVKAVQFEPSADGLTIIGGRNGQGKTSVLDAIAWALGGNNYKPSIPERDGALVPPNLHIELSNGLIVERKGKNSTLKVTDPNGNKSGQQLLNEFVSTLALDLPKFINGSDKDKADSLLKILGIGDVLAQLDTKENQLYAQRTEVGRIADRKKKAADEMPMYPNVPKEPVSATELIKQQQEILARNGENERKRQDAARYEQILANAQIAFDEAKAALQKAEQDCLTARKSAEDLHDESTAELEKNLAEIEALNIKIRANSTKEAAEVEANNLQQEYDGLTEQIESVREERNKLLDSAELPLPGLSVKDGKLIYNNMPWDGMSGSDQLKVATAIVRKLNPQCGFVLMDKLEQMDLETLQEFGVWLKQEGLQVIATRVSTGDECSIIIEDGMVKGDTEAVKEKAPKYVKGVF
ncbi:AAA family ATPase [Dialister invisus]|uniref:AAA family ATPase n=1 Tax=Dialister invisus TaxID=218538 RepID=UPI002E787BE2|nr:AAA family ATPase [Dialister invisus]MEE1473478.1 AAA family ATPase [Dialister invisus]